MYANWTKTETFAVVSLFKDLLHSNNQDNEHFLQVWKALGEAKMVLNIIGAIQKEEAQEIKKRAYIQLKDEEQLKKKMKKIEATLATYETVVRELMSNSSFLPEKPSNERDDDDDDD